MKVVIQRVSSGKVEVKSENYKKEIGKGLILLVGIEFGDKIEDVDFLVNKIINLRIFSDENDKMNYSVLDIQGDILAISQFTLLGNCRKGRRPDFTTAEKPDVAKELFDEFYNKLLESTLKVERGIFAAHMNLEINNDGPVTIIIDSKERNK